MITVDLPPYEHPPKWIPPHERKYHPDFNNDVRQFLPRTVKLRRTKVSDALGFNVRGGKEYLCGVYISKVMPGTEAERLRLREGDQILKVNDISFEDIEHATVIPRPTKNQSSLHACRSNAEDSATDSRDDL
ncbi:PREDICTED: PDZ domain-containing protein 11-like isoform X2 [Priapulus caudatus]|uniref:PDZ domain-containing protein 11-like isoform X2 n=1 Tax=Priapulus caudatus TaxID=37621 RepID=A0ABM1E3T1_PRICU|nr:PREDICTED: PDZ domain-containing protein 11-like isoform X2 [Priapulus caudatus]